jgi:hypothetical protein
MADSAPRRRGSRANASSVCDAARKSIAKRASRLYRTIARSASGSVKTTWK